MCKKYILPGLILLSVSLFAQTGGFDSWLALEAEMRLRLNDAFYTYVSSDAAGACAQMDQVYAGYYRDTDFEKNVKDLVSGERAQNIDDWFAYVKESMLGGKPQREVRENFNQLTYLLRVTAGRLDGKEEPAASARNWTRTADEMAGI
ncbi:MAG: hypothetical protein LBT87_05335, partial [Treponema sp.]|nr:hypothetical protein [Treponema sp.]